ncbi:MAG: argS [Gammaproteobacteria bacterium]|jgi:arginyl-tRNA synthetase|nr:argS [Gammaproteobacteria bacterium]
MSFIKQQLQTIFSQALAKAYPSLADSSIEITASNQAKLADYQCNSAMKLAKLAQTNPRDFANQWCAQIPNAGLIQSIEVAGPGFINIRLAPAAIAQHLMDMLHDQQLGVQAKEIQSQKIIVEFSSPNTAKQMHVGHLRSTIIGDCLARVFEFLGCDVLRLNHVGDWGTAFGMLIAYLKLEHPHVLDGSETADLTALASWYKAAKKRFDEDETFKKNSQLEVVALQSGNAESLKAWQMICQISRQNYQEIYDLLDVKLNERGESFYNPFLAEIITDLETKGLIQVSDGAKCVFLEGFVSREGEPLPMIIQKSDGGYNYSTTDVAAMRHRTQVEGTDRIIVLTDAGQSLHFQMVHKVAEKAGYLINPKDHRVRFDHVTFGLVLGDDGKKIKTRAGDSEPLINLIYTAIDEALKIIQQRDHDLTEAEQKHLAEVLGVNAIKYADLVGNRVADYKFSYERMLRFEGNTAAFLMYAYVRIMSIKRKITERQNATNAIQASTVMHLAHPSELALGLHLARFDEVILQLTDDLLPNRLCEYLYNLAEHFNAFFRDCRVEGSPEETSRLLLCELSAKILETGMKLLGLKTANKM